MPIYEYSCVECQHKFEDYLKVNDPNPGCPKCEGKTEKLISRTFGIVKGSENRTLDCVIGADAEKKWQKIEERKQRRIKEAKSKEIKNDFINC